MKIKPILIEIAWLFGCAIVSYYIFIIFLGNSGLDINLHDTYFVGKTEHSWISFFIIISFFVYYFKEYKYAFCRKIQRSFIFLLGFILILLASLAIQLLPFFNPYHNINGWTISPSLPEQQEMDQIKQNFIILTIVSKAVLILQIIVVTMLLSVTYKWAKSKRITS
jgi:heme/copper-type cytochrome/quinol oxidase subunit 1